jgi:hypothetical protein
MTLRLVSDPRTPGQALAALLTANHADGAGDTGAACDFLGDAKPEKAGALIPQDDGWWCDPTYDGHGLAWWYPHVVNLIGMRGGVGRRGKGGAVAVPIDLSALDFVTGNYWVLEEAPTEATIDDPDSYRTGFVPTVMGLEQSARVALGLGRRPRRRHAGYDGVSIDGRVLDALTWMATHADNLVEQAPMLVATIRHEALRLRGRAAAMLLGGRFEATVNECMYCAQHTVIADEDRAVCRNPECRRPDGTRRCWRLLYSEATAEHVWTEIDEPDVRGRGRLVDDQLPRWHDEAI